MTDGGRNSREKESARTGGGKKHAEKLQIEASLKTSCWREAHFLSLTRPLLLGQREQSDVPSAVKCTSIFYTITLLGGRGTEQEKENVHVGDDRDRVQHSIPAQCHTEQLIHYTELLASNTSMCFNLLTHKVSK